MSGIAAYLISTFHSLSSFLSVQLSIKLNPANYPSKLTAIYANVSEPGPKSLLEQALIALPRLR